MPAGQDSWELVHSLVSWISVDQQCSCLVGTCRFGGRQGVLEAVEGPSTHSDMSWPAVGLPQALVGGTVAVDYSPVLVISDRTANSVRILLLRHRQGIQTAGQAIHRRTCSAGHTHFVAHVHFAAHMVYSGAEGRCKDHVVVHR
jgi:hypothetical protein